MFVKRMSKRVGRGALVAAMAGTLFIGACESQALQAVGVGLNAATSVLDPRTGNTISSFADLIFSRF